MEVSKRCFGGISIWQLLIILLIVLMLFGSRRLRSLGSNLGEAVSGFRRTMGRGETSSPELEQTSQPTRTTQEAAERA
ncbi:twin-arginine translocase TatA/TatE family subunit [Pseudomonas azotifigens]|uniref:Sec-independent protein translocase protein TatA n=2 Tax=Stutzerimonas azotifigens TaxID=291995 RepID=A0ABR5Z0Q3_9GAMM|nr:twin-arginine translocase TatA/TatE family subunit [Stutzerimonas azotifigens]MBA1273792.1 twin-arginine translocase TatA/TatE family subunit [Stutzerimonas azotifigens]